MKSIEYQPHSEAGPWRVQRFEALAAECSDADHPLQAAELPAFHEIARVGSPGRWWIVRRLFGLMPLKLPLNGDPEEFRLLSREEICSSRGISEKELRAELEVLRSAWLKAIQNEKLKIKKEEPRKGEKEQRGKGAEQPVPFSPSPLFSSALVPQAANYPNTQELLSSEDDLLRKHGFSEELFRIPGRSREETMAEKKFLCERILDWEKILTATATKRMAFQALLKEFGLRRMQTRLWYLEAVSYEDRMQEKDRKEEIKTLESRIVKTEEAYERQLQQLQEMAPWWNVTGKTISFAGCVGDLIKAIQEYKADGRTELRDGIFTAAEIWVECLMSLQQPEPQYRLGLVTYLNAAKAGLWDAHWKPARTPAELKLLDEQGRELIKRLAEVTNAPLPDLEADGPGGEFPDMPAEYLSAPPADTVPA